MNSSILHRDIPSQMIREWQRADAMTATAGLSDLRSRFRGDVLSPNDPAYDQARRVWNAMIDRRPALIARCAGAADVICALLFARDSGMAVSVKGGGHNVAGSAVCDAGVMIDLSPMRGVRVDAGARAVTAQGGCTWRDLDHEAHALGLATTGGIIPATGIAGLTLGGGLGWLMRKHGLSCDNLLTVDVITADGKLVQASSQQNADLFWGLRGGGGNFGIATSFEYRLHPVGTVLAGTIVYPLEQASRVLALMRDLAADAPDELAMMAVLMTAPDGAKALAMIACFCGELGPGESALKPLRSFGQPLADTIARVPYTGHQALLQGGFPPGLQNYWKSSFLEDLSDHTIETLIDGFRDVTSPTSALAIELLGGAVARIPENATSFNHRGARFNFLVVSSWSDRSESERHIGWTRQLWQAMQPFASKAVYVNYLGRETDEGADRIREAYGAEKHDRLVALKRKYDPDNVFRLNQNIRP
jgi:FAD/FMN-containing dehydrogenase